MKIDVSTLQRWLMVIALFMLVGIVALLPVGRPAPSAQPTNAPFVPKVQATGVPSNASRFGATQFDGDLFFMQTNPRIVQGPGALSIRNYNDTQDNLLLSQSGNLTLPSGATLTIGTDAMSGIQRHGAATNVVSGTTIAHGFSVAPTTFIVQNATLQPTTFTQTLYAYNCGAISCTIGYSQGAVTQTNVVWIAGK